MTRNTTRPGRPLLRIAAAAWAAVIVSAGATAVAAAVPATTLETIQICHGYGCAYRSRLVLTAADGARFRAIMSAGAGSPRAERAALSKAVSYYEKRAGQATGFRDKPRTQIGKPERGQMDCVDEATNTRNLLLYLAKRGLLRHHSVERNVSRGFFLDNRYPHFTAVVSDPAGVRWVVDSWYGSTGAAPDIMPYETWKRRGQFGT
jgi:hypothetical protein